ncbi:TPA: hypothetical protein ACKPYM_004647 [Stenotrophomonas maltophilia]|nr:hypothetical protein [Stenotrophomonas maltophilia]HEL5350132.1 hypothetical protein [Stenotrophomonas maltophilia]HEL5589174.1 hypothetical protein [Stenotrophomonas maltophilia]HEL5627269.1 hypothetical protein [Stenotrophomonas maltophilia]
MRDTFLNTELRNAKKLDFQIFIHLMIFNNLELHIMNSEQEEDWWDDLIAAERFAVYKVGGDLRILLHHDFDDASVQLLTIDEVLYRIRQALEKGVSISINLETRL